jgi:hypothetical protein
MVIAVRSSSTNGDAPRNIAITTIADTNTQITPQHTRVSGPGLTER